jgi:hypothetical protein
LALFLYGISLATADSSSKNTLFPVLREPLSGVRSVEGDHSWHQLSLRLLALSYQFSFRWC